MKRKLIPLLASLFFINTADTSIIEPRKEFNTDGFVGGESNNKYITFGDSLLFYHTIRLVNEQEIGNSQRVALRPTIESLVVQGKKKVSKDAQTVSYFKTKSVRHEDGSTVFYHLRLSVNTSIDMNLIDVPFGYHVYGFYQLYASKDSVGKDGRSVLKVDLIDGFIPFNSRGVLIPRPVDGFIDRASAAKLEMEPVNFIFRGPDRLAQKFYGQIVEQFK